MSVMQLKNEYFNQRIKCNVSHCKYYDGAQKKCSLGSIEVGVSDSSETKCKSFESNELE